MSVTAGQLEASMGYAPGTLERMAGIFEAGAGYATLRIPSKRGRFRHVVRPTVALDAGLKMLRQSLENNLTFHPRSCVHGCVKGRGIFTNASEHVGQNVVLRLDLRQFFDSISLGQVDLALAAAGLDANGANVVARCTTLNGHLPTGFSTSPLLANLVFDPMDETLQKVAGELGLKYTRYVDDLVFSGDYLDDAIREQLENLLTDCGWKIQHKKTRFMRAGRAQYVTGLSVADPDGPRVPRRMKRFLRLEVHYVTRHGFGSSIIGKRRLLGLINHVKHIEPDLGAQLHQNLKDAGLFTGWVQAEDEMEEDQWSAVEPFWNELGVADDF